LLQDKIYSSYGEAQKIAAINRGLIQIFTHKETGAEIFKFRGSQHPPKGRNRVMQNRVLGVKGNEPLMLQYYMSVTH
jgi:hypothetical protein